MGNTRRPVRAGPARKAEDTPEEVGQKRVTDWVLKFRHVGGSAPCRCAKRRGYRLASTAIPGHWISRSSAVINVASQTCAVAAIKRSAASQWSSTSSSLAIATS